MIKVVGIVQNGMLYISVEGDIEMFNSVEFKKKLHGLSFNSNYSRVELDLIKVNYIDSSGLAMIIGFFKMIRGNGKAIEIVRMKEAVSDLIHLSGLDKFVRENK